MRWLQPVADAPAGGYRQYQLLGGLALVALFFLQAQHDATTPNAIIPQYLLVLSFGILLCGGLGILAERPISPLLVLILLGANHLLFQASVRPTSFGSASVKPSELAMAIAALAYVASHYRLLSLRFHALPADRRRTEAPRRPDAEATPVEIVALVAQLPLFACAAYATWLLLACAPDVVELPQPLLQVVLAVWVLTLGLFLAGAFFRGWRRRQLGPTGGRLMLQDILWQQLRGEERALYRAVAGARARQDATPKSRTGDA